jgi:chemotaxis protein MotB
MSDLSFHQAEPHAEEDENYFISMTDMMVGILFIFIILLMVFALNFRQQTDISEDRIRQLEQVEETVREVNEELKRLKGRVDRELQSMDAADSVRQDMLEEIRAELSRAGINVTVDTENGVLRLRDDAIGFRTDRPNLEAVALANVEKVADALAIVMPRYAEDGGTRPAYIETMFIEGHTDDRGTEQRNLTLSTERAVNTYFAMVRRQAVLKGLHNRAGTEILSVSGYGSSRPVPGVNPNLHDAHRRIDLRFVMDVNNQKRLEEVRGLADAMDQQLRKLDDAVQKAIEGTAVPPADVH